ncbi:hypothetical protein WH47_07444 [Habropoda laboriosa]|uniref:Uncharacterized protein n=1 Tax=Habropoda laboriosa TaxID=597456 RepID=A0A0L7QQC7_9HYME|nr:hypothetical protein WH47_07444 [Habropoda laboriosa]
MVQRFHRQLKAAIKCYATKNWVEILPIAVFGIRLREYFKKLRPSFVPRHGTRTSLIFKELASLPYVFLRHDTVKGPLQPSYDGLFKVLQHGDKIFVININGKQTKVSVDRFKPTFVLIDDDHNVNPERQQNDERDDT